jgi:oligosaccharide repeat unit polymerase
MNAQSTFTAVLVAGFILACIVFDLRRGLYRLLSPRTAVLISVIYWYLLEALRLPKDLASFTQLEYDFGMFCVVLATCTFLAAFHGIHVPLFAPFTRLMRMLEQPRMLWMLVVSGATIGFGSILLYTQFDVAELFEGLTGMRPRWSGSLGRGRYGSWSTIVYELQVFLPAVVPLAIALAFMKRAPTRHRWFCAVFVIWMFLKSFFSGTRSIVLPIALPLAAAIFWNASPRLRRALIVVGIPCGLVGGYFWSAAVVAGRNAGKFDASVVMNVDFVGVEMYRELLFIIKAEEHGMSPEYGSTYFTQLVNPIPRALWPGKPVADAGLVLARAHEALDRFGEPTLTVSPGFLGEAYLNFGFLGLLLVPAAAGVVVRAWDDLLPVGLRSLPAFLVYAGGVATIFACGRSVNFSTFYALMALFFLMRISEVLGIAGLRTAAPTYACPVQRRPLRVTAQTRYEPPVSR